MAERATKKSTAKGAAATTEPRVLCNPVGGLVDETGVCLAIYGEDLHPEHLTAILGCSPSSSHRRGERRQPNSPPHKHGAWLLEVRGMAPEGPEELVTKLLDQLPDDEAIWQKLSELYDVQLRFAFHMTGWNRGFDLAAGLVAKVARLHAKVCFDIYAYEDDDAPESVE